MRMSKQSQPALAGSSYVGPEGQLSISPSDCSDGTLHVWFPDGSSTSVPNIVPCCYSYPSGCNPCGRNWDAYVGTHFTQQCGTNNSYNCIWQESC